MKKFEDVKSFFVCSMFVKHSGKKEVCSDCNLSMPCSCVHNVVDTNHPCPFSAHWLKENEPLYYDQLNKMIEEFEKAIYPSKEMEKGGQE